MIPKRCADLREYDVALRYAPRRDKLRRNAQLRIVHGRRADEVDDVGAAFAHVSALDQISERALGQPDRKPLAQSRHAEIAEPYADCLHRHRPLGEPLHDRAGAVRPVEYEMVAVRFGKRRLDRGAAARHLGRAELRVFRLEKRLEPRRQRWPVALGHALARAIVSGLAASRSSTSLPTATMSALPVASTGSLSRTHTSDGIISSEACFAFAKLWKSP